MFGNNSLPLSLHGPRSRPVPGRPRRRGRRCGCGSLGEAVGVGLDVSVELGDFVRVLGMGMIYGRL